MDRYKEKVTVEVPITKEDDRAYSYRKAIVTHSWGNNPDRDEHRSGNAYIWPNHYHHGLASFIEMFLEAKKAFPELKIEDCECRTVVQSSWCKGMPVLTFSVEADIEREGWTNQDRLHDMQLS